MESLLHARTIQLSSRTPTPASAGATTTVRGGAVGDRRHRRQQLGHQRCAVLRHRRSRLRWWHQVLERQRRSRLTRRRSPPAASRWIRTARTQIRTPTGRSRITSTPGRWKRKRWPDTCRRSFVFDNSVVPVSALLGVRYFDTNTLSEGYNRVQQGAVITLPDSFAGRWLHRLVAVTQSCASTSPTSSSAA